MIYSKGGGGKGGGGGGKAGGGGGGSDGGKGGGTGEVGGAAAAANIGAAIGKTLVLYFLLLVWISVFPFEKGTAIVTYWTFTVTSLYRY